jgi:uncharacterized linocin/CFP29 family protein
VAWAPSLRGGLAVSLRGGDLKLICGRDAAIGYLNDAEKLVSLYLEESFSAELSDSEAVGRCFLSKTATPGSRAS